MNYDPFDYALFDKLPSTGSLLRYSSSLPPSPFYFAFCFEETGYGGQVQLRRNQLGRAGRTGF